MQFFIDLFLNLDTVLQTWVQAYGLWIYAMLFLVIFCETGLVIMPFLPGDSLLFTAGAIAALPSGLNVFVVFAVMFAAAIMGDNVNYLIGRKFGRGLIENGRLSVIIRPNYIVRTDAFFAKHGGKTISLARFFPIIRTFAPFMAGVGQMHWPRFFSFSLAGTTAWVSLFVLSGYFFGNIPIVRDNLELLVIGIIVFTLAPSLIHAIWSRLRSRNEPEKPTAEQPAE